MLQSRKRKLQDIIDTHYNGFKKPRPLEVETKVDTTVTSIRMHIRYLTEPFVRNSTTIQQCLTALIGSCIVLEERAASNDFLYIRRQDGNRLFKISLWSPDNGKVFLCFTDLNRRQNNLIPGYYQYQIAIDQTALLHKLLLPIGVELAANPFEWEISCQSIFDSPIPFTEFANLFCNIFIR